MNSRPRVPFLQHRKVGLRQQATGLYGEVEGPTQHGEFAVDLRVRGFGLLTHGDELAQRRRRDRGHLPVLAEERKQVQPHLALHVLEGLLTVRRVVIHDIGERVLEGQLADRRLRLQTGILRGEALAQFLLGILFEEGVTQDLFTTAFRERLRTSLRSAA